MEIDALNRMLEGMRENEDFRRRERSLNIPGIYQNQGGMGNVANFGDSGGFNFLGIPSGGGRGFVIQTPQLGPDDFGSYVIPPSDPTYRSGFDYARSIAGGIPMSQVIAPGVSYSPEQPMGYTQEQLTTSVGTTPVEPPPPPPAREPDDPRYFGTGIGGVRIHQDPKDIPFRDIFGGVQIPDVPPVSGLQDIGKLFDFDFDREAIEKIVQERIAENMPIENIPSSIPEVPTGREFSVDRQPIPLQDLGYGPGIMPPLPPIDIEDIIRKPGVTTIEEAMEIPKRNNQLFIDDRPIIDERIGMPPPPLPPVDIPPVDIPPVDIPPVDIPFIPFIKPPSIMDRPLIMDTPTIMDRPTGGRFSIEQKRPMGLF